MSIGSLMIPITIIMKILAINLVINNIFCVEGCVFEFQLKDFL